MHIHIKMYSYKTHFPYTYKPTYQTIYVCVLDTQPMYDVSVCLFQLMRFHSCDVARSLQSVHYRIDTMFDSGQPSSRVSMDAGDRLAMPHIYIYIYIVMHPPSLATTESR